MTSEFDIHSHQDPSKLYVSPRFAGDTRIASEVFDSIDFYSHAVELGEVILRVTHGGKQEIVAKFSGGRTRSPCAYVSAVEYHKGGTVR